MRDNAARALGFLRRRGLAQAWNTWHAYFEYQCYVRDKLARHFSLKFKRDKEAFFVEWRRTAVYEVEVRFEKQRQCERNH